MEHQSSPARAFHDRVVANPWAILVVFLATGVAAVLALALLKWEFVRLVRQLNFTGNNGSHPGSEFAHAMLASLAFALLSLPAVTSLAVSWRRFRGSDGTGWLLALGVFGLCSFSILLACGLSILIALASLL